MLAKIPKFSLLDLNGFLPVNKPSGICCNRLLFSLKSDISYILDYSDWKICNLEVEYARHLEPFADGLFTFVLGWGNKRRRNFVHAGYKYRATIELGVKRELDCIDGKVTSITPITHINHEILESALKQFVGTTQQIRKNNFQKPATELRDNMSSIDVYNLIKKEYSWPKEQKPPQKYPQAKQPKDVECSKIELIDYKKPFVDLEITSQGGFGARQFSQDLAARLGTEASLVKLTRIMEGPMHLDDLRVLQLHELNVEYFYNRMPAIQNPYREFLSQFDDLFENEYYKFTASQTHQY